MGIKIAGRSSRELAVLEHVSRRLEHHEKKHKIELTLFAFLKTYISMLIELDGYKMRLLVVQQRIFFLFNVLLETKKTLRVYLTNIQVVFSANQTQGRPRLDCFVYQPALLLESERMFIRKVSFTSICFSVLHFIRFKNRFIRQ